MKILFERSGGFGGIRLTKTLDTSSLPDQESQHVEQLIKDADFFRQSSTTGPRRGADRFQYVVTVEKGDERHTVHIDEENASESLRPLLEYLTQKAKGR